MKNMIELTSREHILIERAAAHAMAEEMLQPAARFERGITDLEVARFMRALESGMPMWQNSYGKWESPLGSPFNGNTLSPVVGECIRTGLVTHHRTGVLIPAMVHHKVWLAGSDRWASRCGVPGEHMGPKRVRLHADPIMVDCLACLDRL